MTSKVWVLSKSYSKCIVKSQTCNAFSWRNGDWVECIFTLEKQWKPELSGTYARDEAKCKQNIRRNWRGWRQSLHYYHHCCEASRRAPFWISMRMYFDYTMQCRRELYYSLSTTIHSSAFLFKYSKTGRPSAVHELGTSYYSVVPFPMK